MSKTLKETVDILNDFVLNNQYGHLISDLAKKVEDFSKEHPDLLSGNVYGENGYDSEFKTSWNELVVESTDGYSNTIVEFPDESNVYANSGYDPELGIDWDEICLDVIVEGRSIGVTVIDLN